MPAELSTLLPSLLASVLVTVTGVLLLVVVDWRFSIGLLSVQYAGVVFLVLQDWPIGMAVTRLVAGWMAGAVLGMAMLSLPQNDQDLADIEARPTRSAAVMRRYRLLPGEAPSPFFHLLVAALVGLAVWAGSPQLVDWLPGISQLHAWAGLILIGLGLLKLGFHTQPLHITLGLLTLFSGFEILYAPLNAAPLIAALTAAVTLGMALTGAFLLLSPHMEPGE